MKIPAIIASLLMVAAAPAAAQDITRADANHDGRITRAEFLAARNASFAQFDRNGDGVISQADIGRFARFRPDLAARFTDLIANADANHDGQVTRDELAVAPAPVFDRADANHDGVIEPNEIAVLRAAMTGLRGRR